MKGNCLESRMCGVLEPASAPRRGHVRSDGIGKTKTGAIGS